MKQLNVMLDRLRNPSVILSVASQIVIILMLLKIDIDRTAVMGIVTAACSILTLLGILSNPSSESKWYNDDIYTCPGCAKETVHVQVNGKMVCTECGTENNSIN